MIQLNGEHYLTVRKKEVIMRMSKNKTIKNNKEVPIVKDYKKGLKKYMIIPAVILLLGLSHGSHVFAAEGDNYEEPMEYHI